MRGKLPIFKICLVNWFKLYIFISRFSQQCFSVYRNISIWKKKSVSRKPNSSYLTEIRLTMTKLFP